MDGLGQPGIPTPAGPDGFPANVTPPSALPAGHPLRMFAEQAGIAPGGPQAAPQVAQPRPQPTTAPPPGFGAPGGSQAANRNTQVPGLPANDPMARPFRLPSSGLPYGTDGVVLISPMRGEQQEIMAGAGDGLAASPSFRHLVRACTHLNGIEFSSLTMQDFQSVMLHVMAMGIGDDLIPMAPTCNKCQHQFDGSMRLSDWPARIIQRVTQGEEITWPPEVTEAEDDDARILREMGLDDESQDGKKSPHTIYTASDWPTSWRVELSNGQVLMLRYLTVKDWEMAEDYAERSGSTGVHPEAALGRFLRARAIESMDGKRPGMLPLMNWCKQSPLSLLREMDEAHNKRAYGYVLDPLFRCPRCSHRFREQLPLSGERLRSHTTFG